MTNALGSMAQAREDFLLDVRLAVVRLEGHHALAAFPSGATTPAYFILLEWDGERVTAIRDFRYVPYIALEADYELVTQVGHVARVTND
jgi:hypothetical protein